MGGGLDHHHKRLIKVPNSRNKKFVELWQEVKPLAYFVPFKDVIEQEGYDIGILQTQPVFSDISFD